MSLPGPERRLLRDSNTSGIRGKAELPGACPSVADDPSRTLEPSIDTLLTEP